MLNFKKKGIFTRQVPKEDASPEQEPQEGILAVWGSPGSGKTVTAVKLAKHLADRKKNVVLLLCDMTAPMMTPGGYVYLTPETAQLLLSGQSVKGNPGSAEFARDVPAEELLEQEICTADFSKGACRRGILTWMCRASGGNTPLLCRRIM